MQRRRNPYARLDKESVLGVLALIGSYDPDILQAARAGLLRQVRAPKITGALAILAGVALALSGPGPLAGLPLLFLGGWLWWRGVRNGEMLNAGFEEFAGTSRR
jgi:hypothetical protein